MHPRSLSRATAHTVRRPPTTRPGDRQRAGARFATFGVTVALATTPLLIGLYLVVYQLASRSAAMITFWGFFGLVTAAATRYAEIRGRRGP